MNKKIRELFEADQKERKYHPQYGTEEYKALRERDRRRRERAQTLINADELSSPEDYYHAAMIFQHGEDLHEIWLAYTLANKSAELGYRPARWLTAAAYDRWLMYQGKPQKYGTQIVPDGKRQRLWDVDPETTDEERAQWDVPPLEQQHARAEELTKAEPMPPMDEAPSWLKKAIKRWKSE